MVQALRLVSVQKTWEDYKIDIERLKKENQFTSEQEAIIFARTFCYSVVKYLWGSINYKSNWQCRQLKFDKVDLDFKAVKLSKEIAGYFNSLNIMEYAYLLGNLYTKLLPDHYRSDNGVYYTPPTLAERLLDILTTEGADWAKASILEIITSSLIPSDVSFRLEPKRVQVQEKGCIITLKGCNVKMYEKIAA